MIGTGAMCDPYMHCEEEVGLTRNCLELIDRYEFGLAKDSVVLLEQMRTLDKRRLKTRVGEIADVLPRFHARTAR